LKQDFNRGIESLQSALRIFSELNDELEISHTLNNIGNLHWLSGQMSEALATYRKALAIQRRLDARAEIASSLGNIGALYCATGRYQRGIRILTLSLDYKKEIGNAGEIARTLNNLGYAYHISGDSRRAVESLTESLQINQRIGSKKEILFNLENLTELMIAAGQLKQSLTYLKEGLELSDALADKPHLGVFHVSMGIVLQRMGRFSEAAGSLDEAGSLAREVDSKHLGLSCALHRAGLRYCLGDRENALEQAVQVLQEAEKIRDMKNHVNALLLLTRLSEDPRYREKVTAIIEDEHLDREKYQVRFATIESMLERNKTDQAIASAQDILDVPLGLSERIELPWMCNLSAEILIASERREEALPYLIRAQRLAGSSGLRPEMAAAFTLQGQVTFQSGDYEQCFALYKQALNISKAIVGTIGDAEDRLLYQNKRSVVFLTGEIRRLSRFLAHKERAG
jgi:tetratricopeptide (TPR) repeat protein